MLSCAELPVREINRRLRELPAGTTARITEPRGRHNLAVGLRHRLDVTVDGNAGYYIGGLCDGPDVTVDGFVGWGVGENLMSGTVRVNGNASESAGASAHGGIVAIAGDASSRAGISLKGGTVVVAGDVGHMSGFMAQAGTMLVGGDAGEALGDSLYEAVIYVAGRVRSLGADARVEDLTDEDVLRVKRLVELTGSTTSTRRTSPGSPPPASSTTSTRSRASGTDMAGDNGRPEPPRRSHSFPRRPWPRSTRWPRRAATRSAAGARQAQAPTFDDLVFLTASASRYPLEGYRERCDTRTVLGGRFASRPLELDIPITIASPSPG